MLEHFLDTDEIWDGADPGHKLAESYMQAAAWSQIPGLEKVAEAHANLRRELTDAYLTAARRLIE